MLVVQPRRMAARSLAVHLAELRGEPVGRTIGYAVRGEARDDDARVLFVTTGVALRLLADGIDRFATVVLDEFHERSLDLDLLAALLLERPQRLVILSATLDAEHVAGRLDADVVRAEGRVFPIEVHYEHADRTLPDPQNLPERVARALERLRDVPGDRLVFVPGRAEVEAVSARVGGTPLHGGLSLAEQHRALRPGRPGRVVVATNVAETSLTIPGIGLVIDSGLVRRTHYHQDRGYLALAPIAHDSAEQRAGRAGRLGPGVAMRLWGRAAPLDVRTPPALHRESLVPVVLGALACGRSPECLVFVDDPPDHALATARAELSRLGALDDDTLTPLGAELFRLPTAPHLARLLTEARTRGLLGRAIDLVAALSGRRRLIVRPAEELAELSCDVHALALAVERGEPARHGLDAVALRDARQEADRLRGLFGVDGVEPWDADAMAALLLAAWPDCAHVARQRGRRVAWSNGGTEVELSRHSQVREGAEAVLALAFRAHGSGRDRTLIITAAMPRTLRQLAAAGLGEERLGPVTVERRRVIGHVERVYAGAVLSEEERTPRGRLAAEAVAELLLRGTLRKGFAARYREAHRLAALWAALEGQPPPDDDLVALLLERGLEQPDDLALLEDEDLFPPSLPDAARTALAEEFPPTVSVGTLRFRVEVVPRGRRVELHNLGARIKTPPSATWLPRFRGWEVVLVDRGKRKRLRGPTR